MLAWSGGRLGSTAQLRRFVGAPDAPIHLEARDSACVYVLAPTYARIRAASLSLPDRQLDAEVECLLSGATSPFTLFALHDALPHPLRFGPRDFKRGTRGRWRLTKRVRPLDGPFELHLLVDDCSVDRQRVGVPRPSTQAHALFDSDDAWLTGLLDDARHQRGADSFEHYVSTLLQLCGIPAVRYGFRSPPNAPDLVAELDEDAVLVGECKVVPPTTDLLQVLHNRALSVAQALWSSRHLAVYPVFFHATSRDRVVPEARRYAYQHGIRLAGREDLQTVQALWERGEAKEVLVRWLLKGRR